MWFTTFFEAQIGDPIWMWIFKGVNCLVWFTTATRIGMFLIQKWKDSKDEKEEDDREVVVIGFR